VADWFHDDNDTLNILRALASQRIICNVVPRNHEERFEFRHDRILEHELSRSLDRMVQDMNANTQVIEEPFYIEFLGRTIARTALADSQIKWLSEHNPLALIAAVSFFDGREPAWEKKIVAAAKRWLSDGHAKRSIPGSQLVEGYRLLEVTDSEFVLTITDDLRSDVEIAPARLANGDVDAGIAFMQYGIQFFPSVHYASLENTVRRANHFHVVADLAKRIESELDGARLMGELVLAGYLGDSSLAHSIGTAWEKCGSDSGFPLSALWAAFRCGSQDPVALLNPMMQKWALLSSEDPHHSGSEIMKVADLLRRVMRHGIAESVLSYLVEIGGTIANLKYPIAWVLQSVDRPVCVRFIAGFLAELRSQAPNHRWIWKFERNWDVITGSDSKTMSSESLGALETLWNDVAQSETLRESAFKMWVQATVEAQPLQRIRPDFPWYESALWQRAMLGDQQVVEPVLAKLPAEPRWFYLVHHIWSPRFLAVTDEALAKLGSMTPPDYSGGITDMHYELSELLRDIPASDAEPLLLKHWNQLKFSPEFIQLALYLGTPQFIELASRSIEKCPAPTELFRYIDMFFGFMTKGLHNRLTQSHLEHLLPFVRLLSGSTLRDILEFCVRNGLRSWAEQNLQDECVRRSKLPTEDRKETDGNGLRRHYFPTDEDLLIELDRLEKDKIAPFRIYYWMLELEHRLALTNRSWPVLERWLEHTCTERRFNMVAEAIANRGNRRELQLLNKFQVEGDPDRIRSIMESTIFTVKRRTLF